MLFLNPIKKTIKQKTMKLKTFSAIFLVAILASCSSDEVSNTPEFQSDSNYFPLNIENSWTYNNELKKEGETAVQGNGTMTVADVSEENGTTFYDLNVDKPEEAGLTTSIFASGKLTKRNGELIFSGTYKIALPGYDFIELPITDVVVFSSTKEAGTVLANFESSQKFFIDAQGQTIPLSINYTVSTINEAFLSAYDAGGKSYEDVLQSSFVIKASVTAEMGPVQLVLMAEQDAVKVSNYYANGVGLIFSTANINYTFEDLSTYGISKLPDVHIESSQEIDVYTVAGE